MSLPVRVVERFCQGRMGFIVPSAMKNVVYSAIFLDDQSHRELLTWWEKATGTPLLGKVFGHHMTIKFKPTPEEVEKLPMGEKVKLKVIGWAADEKAQAVLVDPEVPSTKAKAHITVSTDPGVSPAYSDTLLKTPITHVTGPTLEGVVGTFPRD